MRKGGYDSSHTVITAFADTRIADCGDYGSVCFLRFRQKLVARGGKLLRRRVEDHAKHILEVPRSRLANSGGDVVCRHVSRRHRADRRLGVYVVRRRGEMFPERSGGRMTRLLWMRCGRSGSS